MAGAKAASSSSSCSSPKTDRSCSRRSRPSPRCSARRPDRPPADTARLLVAARGLAGAVVAAVERTQRQPGLATDGPDLVGGDQLVGGVEGAEVHLDLVGATREDGRAAAGTEEPSAEVAGLALDRSRALGEPPAG